MAPTRQATADTDATGFDAIGWALRLGVGLLYIDIGCEKVFPARGSYWVKLFSEIGFGEWFMYLTGTIQIIGGLLMVMPQTAPFGAALLACTMLGAILAHL